MGCTGGPVHLRRWSSARSSEEKPLASRSPEVKLPAKSNPRTSKAGICVNPSMCVLFSPCPFFPLGFWDGVFGEAHMRRLQRTLLVTRDCVENRPLLTGSATYSRCASRDQLAEGLLLGVRLTFPRGKHTFVYKRGIKWWFKGLFVRSRDLVQGSICKFQESSCNIRPHQWNKYKQRRPPPYK